MTASMIVFLAGRFEQGTGTSLPASHHSGDPSPKPREWSGKAVKEAAPAREEVPGAGGAGARRSAECSGDAKRTTNSADVLGGKG
jgi:hypothetical protein